MAFPTQYDYTLYSSHSSQTSFSVDFPSTQAGDLLLLLIGSDGDNSYSSNYGGFTLVGEYSNGNSVYAGVLCKIATGSESGNFSITFNQRENYAVMLLDIQGADSTMPDISVNSGYNDNTLFPPPLTPTWGALDTMWVTFFSQDTSTTNAHVRQYSMPYNQGNLDSDDGFGNVLVGESSDEVNTATLYPNPYTTNISDQWVAYTIGIKPASAYIPQIIVAQNIS
jgi:hypothetical protein